MVLTALAAGALFAESPVPARAVKPASARARSASPAIAREAAKPQAALAKLPRLQRQAAAQSAGGGARRTGGVTSATRGVREVVDLKRNSETILLLAPQGPVVVEMEITIDGRPFRTERETLITEMLKQSDSNQDGEVTWDEAFDNPRFAFGRLSRTARIKQPAYRAMLKKSYDTDKNDKVSRYEVRLLFARFGYGAAFQVYQTFTPAARQPDVKKLLDVNGDGKLTADELQAAPERLKLRDADDNDLLEMAEVSGSGARSPYDLRQRVRTRGVRLPSRAREIYLLGPAADLAAIYDGIVAKYGGPEKKVTAAAFRSAPKMFKKLDLNENGVLDAGESIGLHLVEPAVKLKVALSRNANKTRGLTITSMSKPLENAGPKKKSVEQVSLTMPGSKLRFHVPDTVSRAVDYSRTAQSVLARYDKNKNGYIEKKEMGNSPYYQRQFTRWDLNSDGKVFADEIKQMYDQMQAPQRSVTRAIATGRGASLFAAIDETGDRRISAREMKYAAKRLLALDKNNNGMLDADEMPGEIVITFMEGNSYYRSGGLSRVSRASASRQRGPRWFVHMDRNADGDITPREFLGTRAKFQELDTNNDGFIERKEAEAVKK